MFADAGLPVQLAVHGISAAYTDGAGETLIGDLTVVEEGEGQHVKRETMSGERTEERRSVRMATATVDGANLPRLGDRVVIDGDPWAIEEITDRSASMARLVLMRIGAMERSRSGYRNK